MTTVHIARPEQRELGVVASAIGAVVELVGWEPAAVPEQADWTICLEAPAVEENLRAGRRVLHVGPGERDRRLTYLEHAHPTLYQYASSVGYNKEPAVTAVILRLAQEELEKTGRGVPQVEASAVTTSKPPMGESEPISSESFHFLSPSPVAGLRIMVVDDKPRNLRSAEAQLGVGNEVTTFRCYQDVCKALSAGGPVPDLFLSDMLMPTEEFCLGDKARAAFLGMELPAGIFIALIAARAGVPRIVIQTDAGHHDHPALALVDYMGWGRDFSVEQSKVQIVQARINEGVKDWGLGLAPA